MGNSIVSYIHSTFLVFSQWTLWLLVTTYECFIEYRFQMQKTSSKTQKRWSCSSQRQRRSNVLPAEYFPWPLHMVKAISQSKKKKVRAGNEQSSKVETSATTVTLLRLDWVKGMCWNCVCVQMHSYLQRWHYARALNNLVMKQPGLSFPIGARREMYWILVRCVNRKKTDNFWAFLNTWAI